MPSRRFIIRSLQNDPDKRKMLTHSFYRHERFSGIRILHIADIRRQNTPNDTAIRQTKLKMRMSQKGTSSFPFLQTGKPVYFNADKAAS